ncbi:uncharacterized protein LOC6031345 [Culex quinquefasciatus]|uniref:uncharacterized protein LOC6031345 n=1 Tax=Culex quinquefasciatus TaxID=7176 RepID=UPI0018E2A64C|nr:uncharacterized protein LOC6031345 [Culex quinquefasciatus]
MKSFVIFSIVLVGMTAVLADRPKSETVISTVKTLRPRYREIQDFVIHTLSDARLSSSEKLNVFHEDVLIVKETFVLDAIKKENKLLYQINNQPASVNSGCLDFVRSLADSVMNLAGTAYSGCISDANTALTAEISKFYAAMQKDESDYLGIGLLNVFKDENIFYNPDSILSKLSSKSGELEQYPTSLYDEVNAWVSQLGVTMDNLERSYITCMTDGEQRLKIGMELAHDNMMATCKAVEVPSAPESLPGQISPEQSIPEDYKQYQQDYPVASIPQAPVFRGTPVAEPSDFLRMFRERFGL